MKELPSPVKSIDMAGENQQAKTLYDKLWDDHLVKQRDDGSALLYIDRHLLHEVTSPHTTVIPGKVKPCSGPTTCAMP